MAGDDPDDRFLMEQALLDIGNDADLRFAEDGEELMNYLLRSGKYTDVKLSPRPVLIFLDLNMPRKDGRQVLWEIKTDPDLKKIPVVIWTTSEEEEDRVITGHPPFLSLTFPVWHDACNDKDSLKRFSLKAEGKTKQPGPVQPARDVKAEAI